MADLDTYGVDVRGYDTALTYTFVEVGLADVLDKVARIVRQCGVSLPEHDPGQPLVITVRRW